MGVNSVSGLDRAVQDRVYAAPAPQLRTTEANPTGAKLAQAVQAARPAGKPKEEQVQPVKVPAKAEPAPNITAQTTRIRVDEKTKRIVTQIIGKDNEVIRQIPDQELLEIGALAEKLQGLIFDRHA